MPELLKLRCARPADIRIWSAGCASGEEAYSLGILAIEVAGTKACSLVFGTDINREAIEEAESGKYSRARFSSTRLELLDNHFVRNGDLYVVNQVLRDSVHFSQMDLASQKSHLPNESIFKTYDLVLCRNVLIYFTGSQRERVFQNLMNAVAEGGYLVLGKSEYLPSPYDKHFDRPFGNKPMYRRISA